MKNTKSNQEALWIRVSSVLWKINSSNREGRAAGLNTAAPSRVLKTTTWWLSAFTTTIAGREQDAVTSQQEWTRPDWNMTDCLSSNTGDRRHKQELLTKHVLKAILELVACSGRTHCTNNQQSGTFVCVISCLIKQFESNQAHLGWKSNMQGEFSLSSFHSGKKDVNPRFLAMDLTTFLHLLVM